MQIRLNTTSPTLTPNVSPRFAAWNNVLTDTSEYGLGELKTIGPEGDYPDLDTFVRTMSDKYSTGLIDAGYTQDGNNLTLYTKDTTQKRADNT